MAKRRRDSIDLNKRTLLPHTGLSNVTHFMIPFRNGSVYWGLFLCFSGIQFGKMLFHTDSNQCVPLTHNEEVSSLACVATGLCR